MKDTFTLDTSGVVYPMEPRVNVRGCAANAVVWSDLSPFAQGYTAPILEAVGAPFHKLAPATLAAILKDCEDHVSGWRGAPIEWNARQGGLFWSQRRRGLHYRFPPQVPTLGEDGLVYLREGA